MLDNISGRFDGILKTLRRNTKLSESNIQSGLREVKLALLEADVNYKVVKEFVELVSKEAIGHKVLKSVSPTEQFIKIVHDKLVDIMGSSIDVGLNIKKQGQLSIIFLVGLQGSGKTTTSGKLAYSLKGKHRVLLSSTDTHRPAAKEQLKVLAKDSGVGFFDDDSNSPYTLCKRAISYAKSEGYHVLIVDTAGRLSIDGALMKELVKLKKLAAPDEILFVSDSMAGQSVASTVLEFDKLIGITGIVLTKFDSDARGGAALSLKRTTGKSIKFIGVGEKKENLEPFHPSRIASRILGKGDIVSFVEKVSSVIDEEETLKTNKKLLKNKFDLEDFLLQIKQIKKMGSLDSLVKMLPFANSIKDKEASINDKDLIHKEAIILSMTKKERQNVRILDGRRRRRIANGSGRTIQEVNGLLKQFEQMQKMMKRLKKNPSLFEKSLNLGNMKKL